MNAGVAGQQSEAHEVFLPDRLVRLDDKSERCGGLCGGAGEFHFQRRFPDDLIVKIITAALIHGDGHGRLIRAGQIVRRGQDNLHPGRVAAGAEQEHEDQQEKHRRIRCHVERCAREPGATTNFHADLGRPFSVTMATISFAARPMSDTMLFTRLTR